MRVALSWFLILWAWFVTTWATALMAQAMMSGGLNLAVNGDDVFKVMLQSVFLALIFLLPVYGAGSFIDAVLRRLDLGLRGIDVVLVMVPTVFFAYTWSDTTPDPYGVSFGTGDCLAIDRGVLTECGSILSIREFITGLIASLLVVLGRLSASRSLRRAIP